MGFMSYWGGRAAAFKPHARLRCRCVIADPGNGHRPRSQAHRHLPQIVFSQSSAARTGKTCLSWRGRGLCLPHGSSTIPSGKSESLESVRLGCAATSLRQDNAFGQHPSRRQSADSGNGHFPAVTPPYRAAASGRCCQCCQTPF
jgi:hypothetical protein